MVFKRLIEIGAKVLDILEDSYVPEYTQFDSLCESCNQNETTYYVSARNNNELIKSTDERYGNIFDEIIGYSDIKKEFAKALGSSSRVSILLVGPPGCGKSEFLKQIAKSFPDRSLFIDGTYGSKAGIFERIKNTRPSYVLLDEIDKLGPSDQEGLLNLMESGRLTKTTKSENYDIELKSWVLATANNKDHILGTLSDRFETYYLTEYTDDQFRSIAAKRLRQEGIENEELALYIANAVLRGLGRKSPRDAIRIARKSKTLQDVDETIQTLKKYDLKRS
jgi:MoxR-like ATPase